MFFKNTSFYIVLYYKSWKNIQISSMIIWQFMLYFKKLILILILNFLTYLINNTIYLWRISIENVYVFHTLIEEFLEYWFYNRQHSVNLNAFFFGLFLLNVYFSFKFRSRLLSRRITSSAKYAFSFQCKFIISKKERNHSLIIF